MTWSRVTARSAAVAVAINATAFEMCLELVCESASGTRDEVDRIAGTTLTAPTRPKLKKTAPDRSGASQKPSARDVKG